VRKSLIGIACTLLLAASAGAATLAEVTLPDHVDAGGKSLVLNGLSLRKKFGFSVYVGGLYLAAKEKSAAKILGADEPRRMVLHFKRDVGGDKMCEAWNEGLEDNTPKAAADVKKNFAALCKMMEEVKENKEIVLTYVPGTGTEVSVNGKVKGTVPGKPTSDAILSTWIGPKPGPGDDFKKAVLGG
jgi:hypothetical protein